MAFIERREEPALCVHPIHGHIAIASGLYFTFLGRPFLPASVCLSVNVSIKFRAPRYLAPACPFLFSLYVFRGIFVISLQLQL